MTTSHEEQTDQLACSAELVSASNPSTGMGMLESDQDKDAGLDFEPQALTDDLITEIRARRPLFDARSDYNAMVCDELLRCGEIPTQKNVLAIGKWGSTKDVSRDVAVWRQSFTKRLQPGPLPFAAQRLANQMLAQLMSLCQKAAAEPMESALATLQSQLEQAQTTAAQEREALSQALARSEEKAVQLTEELAQTTALLQRQSDEQARAQERIVALESSVVTLNVEKRQAETSARETVARLEASHERERAAATEANNRMLNQIKDEHREVVGELKARITKLEAAVDGANRQASNQIEIARSEARKWQEHARAATEQVESARRGESEVRERFATETVKLAKAESKIDNLELQVQQLQIALAAKSDD